MERDSSRCHRPFFGPAGTATVLPGPTRAGDPQRMGVGRLMTTSRLRRDQLGPRRARRPQKNGEVQASARGVRSSSARWRSTPRRAAAHAGRRAGSGACRAISSPKHRGLLVEPVLLLLADGWNPCLDAPDNGIDVTLYLRRRDAHDGVSLGEHLLVSATLLRFPSDVALTSTIQMQPTCTS